MSHDIYEKLGNFVNGVGAIRMLLQRAHKDGFLIEGIVLYTALVDGLLRIAIVLKHQIINKTDTFDSKYIHQEDDRDYYSERNIYKQALALGIVDKDLFDELDSLYNFRNKIVHRFLLSEIEYSHLGLVLDRYELIYLRLHNVVYKLESEQIYLGTGMTVSKKTTEEDKARISKEILQKIETNDPVKLKKILDKVLVRGGEFFSEQAERERIREEVEEEVEVREEMAKIPPGFTSVKEVATWARRKGLFNDCVCGHAKMYHYDLSGRSRNNFDENLKTCKKSRCRCKAFSGL